MHQPNAFTALKYDCNRAPAGESMHHGGDFGRYMELKNQKLGEQFAEKQKRAMDIRQSLSNIFSGVTIHVNGFTSPSHRVCTAPSHVASLQCHGIQHAACSSRVAIEWPEKEPGFAGCIREFMVVQELEQLMSMHGGKFANYYYKDTVTHVVCDNLPDTKLKQLLKSKSATPVVRAAWVTESIAAGKLLPPSQFALDRVAASSAQQRMCAPTVNLAQPLRQQDIYPQLNPQQYQQTAHELLGGASAAASTTPVSRRPGTAISSPQQGTAAHRLMPRQQMSSTTVERADGHHLTPACYPFAGTFQGRGPVMLPPEAAACSRTPNISETYVMPTALIAAERLGGSSTPHRSLLAVNENDQVTTISSNQACFGGDTHTGRTGATASNKGPTISKQTVSTILPLGVQTCKWL
jgi:hypothetical protein